MHAIVHPGNPGYPVDLEKVVPAAKNHAKALTFTAVQSGVVSRVKQGSADSLSHPI